MRRRRRLASQSRWLCSLRPYFCFSRAAATRDARHVITIWHQSRPGGAARFCRTKSSGSRPAIRNVHVRALYKETEELRSGFQAAALAGGGPELVYGPSDVLDTFQTMGICRTWRRGFRPSCATISSTGAHVSAVARRIRPKRELVQVGDRFGNHLALVYNRRFIQTPPKTTDELIELAVENTIDENGDGRKRPLRPGVEFYGAVLRDSVSDRLRRLGVCGAEPRRTDKPPCTARARARYAASRSRAYRFIKSLRDEHGVVPANCDYELADSLFKTGRAAMIINGDWSWADYLNNPEIDAAVAVLPTS